MPLPNRTATVVILMAATAHGLEILSVGENEIRGTSMGRRQGGRPVPKPRAKSFQDTTKVQSPNQFYESDYSAVEARRYETEAHAR
ncbi:hypothetical protein Pmar_PMAR009534 [Perkinsus marinus ATCC 50983]|uniref:Secreted protein n=1 Tax=Perkinsus marinus (strain ATCC 50983 / TXsc) TaxID=423536 RepID=C5KEG2_PERM5|nr:hypothetical protein Pmar_PMAR009534 [Perkinsus marinus ATCC 50983]EER17100.1 hypothetical protein Pmar_PMAR009534 [Perkinsus marinus ATCC 50983]|eukprot:XP_002785304.1 hypothetical protein Pmar_PMAR009534 [Perkinsus marinus ATCC 50983]